MGTTYSHEKQKEWIHINRVSRQEQYDWFKTLRDATDDDVIQIMKSSPQMITTVMFFDIYVKNDKPCDCSFELENCVLPKNSEPHDNIKHRLEKSVATGVCPHILLEENKPDINVLEVSDEELDAAFYNYSTDCMDNTPTSNRQGFGYGFYWIHLAVIYKRTKVIRDMLPVLAEYVFPSFVWYTLQNGFSPLYLALLSEDEEISSLLSKYNPKFLQDKLRQKFFHINPIQCNTVPMIFRIASLDKVAALQTFINIDRTKNRQLLKAALKGAFSTHATSCILFLMEKGVKLDSATLKAEINSAVFRGDAETLDVLLKYHKFKVTSLQVKLAVKKGKIDVIKTILDYLPRLHPNSRDYKEYSECIIDAVLNNSSPILQLLIQKNFDVNACLKNLSALKWAEIFEYKDIEHLLTESGSHSFLENQSETISIFNSVLNINQRNDHMIRRLLEIGRDVNDASDGTPPFYTTMRLRRYDLMHEILLCGADPYLQPETWKYFLIRQETAENWKLMLHVFVRANANLSIDTKMTLIQYICDRGASHLFRNDDLILIIVLSAHTITENDKILLRENRHKWSDNLKSKIDDYFQKPLTLKIMCRNSIRKQFGQNLHRFIQINRDNLPTKFVSFLECSDVLELFFTDHDRKKFDTQ
ncbi:uncharacterized protein LOC134724977 [Mytilus trossulus]|uniref:uncharacterized protein LOC134724977 n=1 Tax=Mytilus trossulus TaxID=6551 RepID=UPI003005000E